VWGITTAVNRIDRSYTALLVIGIGLAVGFALYALDVPWVLVIAVVLAFAFGSMLALTRVRRRTIR
jgi:uncharacterized membrane protein